jgi:hypothetical protein
MVGVGPDLVGDMGEEVRMPAESVLGPKVLKAETTRFGEASMGVASCGMGGAGWMSSSGEADAEPAMCRCAVGGRPEGTVTR